MHVLGVRSHDVGGEGTKGVLHHLHVVVEVAGSGQLGERGESGRVTVAGQGLAIGRGEGVVTPEVLAPDAAGDQVVGAIGGERRGDLALGLATGAVREQHAGHRRGRRGMGEVVGQGLAGIRAAELGESRRRRDRSPPRWRRRGR